MCKASSIYVGSWEEGISYKVKTGHPLLMSEVERRVCRTEDGLNQSLLEYKAMNVERQRCIFVELWYDSMLIILWRNNGFLHVFHDFWKSNAFSKNFVRTKLFSIKFSSEWVYFRARKTRCSSIYVEKIVKNHLWEDITILRGRGCLATKININFFVRNKVLNIFHITIFSKKKERKNIFQNNREK